MKPRQKIMFIGFGLLGASTLDMLMQRPSCNYDYTIAGRNLDRITERSNLSALLATQLGNPCVVNCVQMDLNNIEQTAETISACKPDVIFSSVAMQSWNGVKASLSEEVLQQAAVARRGSWLPLSLTLVYKLMQAIKMTDLPTMVVNASYPDVINPMLKGAGFGSLIGIGNISNCIPALRSALAYELNAPVKDIDVRLFAAHAWSHKFDVSGDTGGAPFHLTVYRNGEDVTEDCDFEKAFPHVVTRFRRPGGLERVPMTASSAVAVLDALASENDIIVHAPGLLGLPGGYPFRMSKKNISVELPEGLTLQEAVDVNESCQRYDGIDSIDDNGVVHFTDEEVLLMKNTFGYEKKSMAVEESEDCALTLMSCWDQFVKNYSRQDSLNSADADL